MAVLRPGGSAWRLGAKVPGQKSTTPTRSTYIFSGVAERGDTTWVPRMTWNGVSRSTIQKSPSARAAARLGNSCILCRSRLGQRLRLASERSRRAEFIATLWTRACSRLDPARGALAPRSWVSHLRWDFARSVLWQDFRSPRQIPHRTKKVRILRLRNRANEGVSPGLQNRR